MNHILLVDDDTNNVEILKEILEAQDLNISTAYWGLAGIDLAIKEVPDVILLDVMMPDLSGIDVCKEIRKISKLSDTAIIMMTGMGSRNIKLQALESGANEFLNKPLDPIELSTRIKNQLRIKNAKEKVKHALRELNKINEYSESILENLRLSLFDFPETIDFMIQQVVHSYSQPEEVPETIIFGSRTATDQYQLYTFRLEGYQIIQRETGIFDYIIKEPLNLVGDFAYLNFEHHENARLNLELFHPRILEWSGDVRNGLIYWRSDAFFINFNFNKFSSSTMLEPVIRGFVLHLNYYLTLFKQVRKIQEFFYYSIGALARAAEVNDEDTGKHINRVNEYAYIIARELNLDNEFCNKIRIMAQLHDVGKIHIHPDILKKTSKLTTEEWEIIKTHTNHGAKIIGSYDEFEMARRVALEHHENYDGSGYPQGLHSYEISLAARIVKISDVYDALRNKRTYKPHFSHEKTIDIILKGDERVMPSHFDPKILSCFADIHLKFDELYRHLSDD